MAFVYTKYYDNTYILSLKDSKGDKPEVYFVVSPQRGPGKTYSFTKTIFEEFTKNGKKPIFITRRKKSLGSIAEGIMKPYLTQEQSGYSVSEKVQMKGTYSNIYLNTSVEGDVNTTHFGYVIPIASVNEIKLISGLFNDAWCLLFDEFQPKDPHDYLRDEVDNLLDIHKSVARGEGKAIRYMPIFFLSNAIRLFNPYFIKSGLVKKIQSNTSLFVGDGVVFEKVSVKGLADKQKSNGVSRVFTSDDDSYCDDTWLAEDTTCLGKPDGWGRAIYLATLLYKEKSFALKLYPEVGLHYLDYNVDSGCKYVYNLSLNGNLNIPLIKTSPIVTTIKTSLMNGTLRMKDTMIKEVVLDLFA